VLTTEETEIDISVYVKIQVNNCSISDAMQHQRKFTTSCGVTAIGSDYTYASNESHLVARKREREYHLVLEENPIPIISLLQTQRPVSRFHLTVSTNEGSR
jgi:hypothetical protein